MGHRRLWEGERAGRNFQSMDLLSLAQVELTLHRVSVLQIYTDLQNLFMLKQLYFIFIK